ncbi:MAG: hypothetical protein JW814_00910 [Candidatus Krumholzibacteriota bacterium]|nr:hypothetical protein [Candidatus Krumholzibacteriota bacterium]
MNERYGWIELRKKIFAVIAEEFALRSSIGEKIFHEIYIDREQVPALKHLLSQYIPDEQTLVEILGAIAERTGLEESKVRSLFDRDEILPQFAERLLRAGAFKEIRGKRENG